MALAFPAIGGLIALQAFLPFASAYSSRDGRAPERFGAAPQIPSGTTAAGALPGSTRLRFDVVLRPRNPGRLHALAVAVATPGSAQYRHFLSTAQFAAEFGPSPAAIGQAEAALRSAGLTPGPVSANDLVIPVTTTMGQASASLATSFERYRLPTGKIGYANTSAPRLPAAVAQVTQAVIGLSNLTTARWAPPMRAAASRRAVAAAAATRAAATAASPAASTPTACKAAAQAAKNMHGWTYNQLARAYSLTGLYGKGDRGRGTTVALFELDAWSAGDVASFQKCYGTSVPVTSVSVDGGDGGDGTAPGVGEAALDIDTVIALAPKASLLVYGAPPGNYALSTVDEYTAIIDDDAAEVVSASYGLCEAYVQAAYPGLVAAENTVFTQAAVEGISVLAASGDTGSEGCLRSDNSKALGVLDPAAQPFVTAVGGTQLTKLGPAPTERVWNQAKVGAAGGGVSRVWARPSWQKGRGVISKYSSGKPCGVTAGYCREVPDVSASAADPDGYLIRWAGRWLAVGGTSAATPLWAALIADIDSEQSPAIHLGFLNPQLYSLPKGTLNDITTGNSDFTRTHRGRYPATAGYDLGSGLGTPIATKLAKALRPPIVFAGSPGTGAPPAKLGPDTITKFGKDAQPVDVFTSGVDGPAGEVDFAPDLEHLTVGDGWTTWSHGYTGDVYFSDKGDVATSITLTLPVGTKAFYLYAEPADFADFTVQAVAQNGTSSGPVTVNGEAGARYFGFYAVNGYQLRTITISCSEDFAIGEFGISPG
jgi:subtilase family serine protease